MERTAFSILQDLHIREPERICLHLLQSGHPDRDITMERLLRGAASYARAYQQEGIGPGEVIILILPHGLDLILAFWGAVLHGAIPSIMPFLTEKLLPERYRTDLASLLSVTRPSAIVTYDAFRAEVEKAAAGSSVRSILLESGISGETEVDFDLMAGRLRKPDDIIFLQHSSGTTGLQKGVAITHRALLNQLESYARAIRLERDDVIVSWLPLYHDMGLIAGFLLPILRGVPLVLMSPFDWVKNPSRLMQAVSHFRGTVSWLPNFAYNFCARKIRDAQLHGLDLSSWRAVINCSEPMTERSFLVFADRFAPYGFRRSALATSYAMAENVFAVTQGGIDEPYAVDEVDADLLQMEGRAQPSQAKDGRSTFRMLSCGKPIDGTEVRVLDMVERQELPERRVGELAVRSNCMLAEYYHRPDATESAMFEGWYLTGDLGYMADGEVYVTGRKKDLIIVGGRNVFPQDIEAAASEVAGVHPGRVAAFGIFNDDMGTEEVALVAEVEQPENVLVDIDQRAALEDAIRLAVNQGTAVTLRFIKLVGPHWLVKTSSGKTARSANRAKFLSEGNQ